MTTRSEGSNIESETDGEQWRDRAGEKDGQRAMERAGAGGCGGVVVLERSPHVEWVQPVE